MYNVTFLFMLSILLDQFSLVIGWLFYNFKSSIPNKSDSLFGKKRLQAYFLEYCYANAMIRLCARQSFYRFLEYYSANAIIGFCACRSFHRNSPSTNKNKFAGAASKTALTNNCSTFSYNFAML